MTDYDAKRPAGPVARLIATWDRHTIPDDPAAADIVYIAGPMSGIPLHNYPTFYDKARELRAQGHTVINPAELHGTDTSHDWDWYLRRDLHQLVKCNRVVLLPGWRGSRGAQLEHHVAQAIGMEITYPAEDHDA